MRSLVFATLLIAVFSVGLFAQVNEPSKEKWQTITDSGVSVDVPVRLDEEKLTDQIDRLNRAVLKTEDKPDEDTVRRSAQLNGTYYFAFSIAPKDTMTQSTAMEFIQKYDKDGQRISFGYQEGRSYSFKDSDGYLHRAILIKTSSRIYLFHTLDLDQTGFSGERFIRSVKVAGVGYVDKTPNVSAPAPSAASTSAPPPPAISPVKPPPPIASVSQDKRVALKLLQKPQALYTRAAVLYGIQGSVLIRLTFLAEGKIGGMDAPTKLPFGLTDTSKEAARQIVFEPQRMNDKPISVTKTIAYTFTIY